MSDISKLPKWAQKELEKLRRDLASCQATLRQFEGKEESNVYIVNGCALSPLPADSTIEFHISKGKVKFHINHKADTLEVYCFSNEGHMVLKPHFSNTFSIKFMKDTD